MKPILTAIALVIITVAIGKLIMIKEECGDRQAVLHRDGSYECVRGES